MTLKLVNTAAALLLAATSSLLPEAAIANQKHHSHHNSPHHSAQHHHSNPNHPHHSNHQNHSNHNFGPQFRHSEHYKNHRYHGFYGRWYGPHHSNRWTWNHWGALAGGALIGGLVSDAFEAKRDTIVVPNTTYRLNYDSVQADGNTASFMIDGLSMQADCSTGFLNGHVPVNQEEAHLVNAACSIAFGS